MRLFSPSFFLVIKGFWGTAWKKFLSAEFKDIPFKLPDCQCAQTASRFNMWTPR